MGTGITLEPAVLARVRRLVDEGRRADAVREVRRTAGVGVSDAAAFVADLWDGALPVVTDSSPTPDTAAPEMTSKDWRSLRKCIQDQVDRYENGPHLPSVRDGLNGALAYMDGIEQYRAMDVPAPAAGSVAGTPTPDWSALNDACMEYSAAYMDEDDSGLPPTLDKVRAALRGEDPYNPVGVGAPTPTLAPAGFFHVGDQVRNRHTLAVMTVNDAGWWEERFYELVECPHASAGSAAALTDDLPEPTGTWTDGVPYWDAEARTITAQVDDNGRPYTRLNGQIWLDTEAEAVGLALVAAAREARRLAAEAGDGGE